MWNQEVWVSVIIFDKWVVQRIRNCIGTLLSFSYDQGQRQGGARGTCPPNRLAWPPINKSFLLKTAAFVLIFKLWPPLINACPPKSTALAPALAAIKKIFKYHMLIFWWNHQLRSSQHFKNYRLTRYLSEEMLIRIRSSPTLTFSPSDLCFDLGWTVHQVSSPAVKMFKYRYNWAAQGRIWTLRSPMLFGLHDCR